MEKRIFLIDDEASLRRTLSLGLMQHGYETEPCESGMKALKMLEMYKTRRDGKDYVVLDVRLPDIDGLKLLRVIKHIYPDLPVIMITGYANEQVIEDARLENVDGFLQKPFTIDDLTRVIDDITPEKFEAKKSVPAADIVEEDQKTSSVYVMLKFDPSVDLLPIFRDLYFNEYTLYCDATRGEYDLVLLLQADSADKINDMVQANIKSLPGVTEIVTMPVEPPVIEESINNMMAVVDEALGRDRGDNTVDNKRTFRGGASSYVFVEIEKEKLDTIYPTLYLNDHVVYCDTIKGRYDMVLLVKGTSFADIDATIREQFKQIDGVLRIKEFPIINFFEN